MTRRIFAESNGVNAIITTITELAGVSLKANGVRQGQGLVILVMAEITTGANTSAVAINVRELLGIAGTVVGETWTDITGMVGSHGRVISAMVITNAFQDDPVYQLTVALSEATGNGTLAFSSIVVMVVD